MYLSVISHKGIQAEMLDCMINHDNRGTFYVNFFSVDGRRMSVDEELTYLNGIGMNNHEVVMFLTEHMSEIYNMTVSKSLLGERFLIRKMRNIDIQLRKYFTIEYVKEPVQLMSYKLYVLNDDTGNNEWYHLSNKVCDLCDNHISLGATGYMYWLEFFKGVQNRQGSYYFCKKPSESQVNWKITVKDWKGIDTVIGKSVVLGV